MTNEYGPSPYDFVAEHVEAYERTGGAEGAEYHGIPCVILTTVGRKTAKTRKSPVVRIRDGDNYLAVASMGGQPKHPVWYLNLVAAPDVIVQDQTVKHELTARTATGAERGGLWEIATSVYPEYDEYQTRCERQIPVVVLEPRATVIRGD